MLGKFNHLTFATARNSPQVSALTKTDPELADDASEALGNLLTFALNQFNVGNNMSDVQVAILANDLLKTYWYWRFDEFAYVLGQAVRGKFGTVYNRIDAPTVGEWCEKYSADREALLVVECEERAKTYKLAETAPVNWLPSLDPEAQALRTQLEKLSDADLKRGWDYYRSLPEPLAPTDALKLAVATRLVNERRTAHYLPLIMAQFQTSTGKTPEQQEAQLRAEERRIKIALLQGDYEAAGLRPGGPIAEKLDWDGSPAPA